MSTNFLIYEPRPLLRAEMYYQQFLKYEPNFLPGVVQIEDYHYSVLELDKRLADNDIDLSWDIKSKRQKYLLDRGADVKVTLIVGESAMHVLQRLDCKEKQLETMVEATATGWDIRILPVPNPWMSAGFEAYYSADASLPHKPPFVYLEVPDMSQYIEDRTRVKTYSNLFDMLRSNSQPLGEYLC